MTIKNEISGKYGCIGCGKEYYHPQEADACRDSHNLIYIALTKEDLNRLIMFLQLKDDDLLTESLVKTLHRSYFNRKKENIGENDFIYKNKSKKEVDEV